MVSALDNGRAEFKIWPSQCVVFFGKRHFTLSVWLSTQVYVYTQAWWIARGGGGGVLAMDWYPIQGGVVIRVVSSW